MKLHTDALMVRKVRQMQALLERVREIYYEIEASDHPNAAAIACALDAECVPLAFATHVAHDYLVTPSQWTDDLERKV